MNSEKGGEKNKGLSRRESFGALTGMFLAMRKSGEAQVREDRSHTEKRILPDYALKIPDEHKIDVVKLKIYLGSEQVQSLLSSIDSKIHPVPASFVSNFKNFIDSIRDLQNRENDFGSMKKQLADTKVPKEQKSAVIKILEREQKQIPEDYEYFARIFEQLIDKAGRTKQAKAREGKPTIVGFEKMSGLDNADIGLLLSKLPRNLYSDVGEIRYVNEKEVDTAGEAKNSSALFVDPLLEARSSKIVVLKAFEGIEKETKMQHAERLVHELAHLVDWKNSIRLEMADRLIFYNEAADILLANDRSHDWYLDDYLSKNYNKMDFDNQRERERYLYDEQITELWAQFVSRYFIEQVTGKPGRSSDLLNSREKAFTEKWLGKMDIKF